MKESFYKTCGFDGRHTVLTIHRFLLCFVFTVWPRHVNFFLWLCAWCDRLGWCRRLWSEIEKVKLGYELFNWTRRTGFPNCGSGARLMGTDGSRQMEEWERESIAPQSKERKQIWRSPIWAYFYGMKITTHESTEKKIMVDNKQREWFSSKGFSGPKTRAKLAGL